MTNSLTELNRLSKWFFSCIVQSVWFFFQIKSDSSRCLVFSQILFGWLDHLDRLFVWSSFNLHNFHETILKSQILWNEWTLSVQIWTISNLISNSHFVSTPHALFLKGDAKNTNIIFSGDSQHLLGGCYTHTPTVATPYSMTTLFEYSEAQLNSNKPSKWENYQKNIFKVKWLQQKSAWLSKIDFVLMILN